jgi:hypothetical protein
MHNVDNVSKLKVRDWPRHVECNVQSFRGKEQHSCGSFICHGISHTHEGTFATLEDSHGRLIVQPLDMVHWFAFADEREAPHDAQ